MERLKTQNLKVISAAMALVMVAGSACAETTVYGHVNRAMQRVDDGHSVYMTNVDNEHSQSRLGVKWWANFDSCLKIGAKLEMGFDSSGTYSVTQLSNAPTTPFSLRQADTWIEHSIWGTVNLGHGSEASDDMFELSMADTWNTSYYGVGDLAGTMIFHPKTGGVGQSGTFGDANANVSNTFSNLDTGRNDRVMYTTPNWNGFTGKVSWANQGAQRVNADIAVHYAGGWDDFDFEAAIAMRERSQGVDAQALKVFGGSFAMIHKPTAINFAFTFAQQDNVAVGRDDTTTYYVQLGKHFSWLKYGKTNLAVDYYHGKDTYVNFDKAKSYGFGMEQKLDKANSAVYLLVRNFDYTGATTQYDNMWVIALGMKVAFSRVI